MTSTVLRFQDVPMDRIEEIKKEIEDFRYPEETIWGPRERTTFSIGLSNLKDDDAHYKQVVSELTKLTAMIEKWRLLVDTIYVDIGLFTKEPSTEPNASIRCCDFPINKGLIKFCYENQIWINATIYGVHLED